MFDGASGVWTWSLRLWNVGSMMRSTRPCALINFERVFECGIRKKGVQDLKGWDVVCSIFRCKWLPATWTNYPTFVDQDTPSKARTLCCAQSFGGNRFWPFIALCQQQRFAVLGREETPSCWVPFSVCSVKATSTNRKSSDTVNGLKEAPR